MFFWDVFQKLEHRQKFKKTEYSPCRTSVQRFERPKGKQKTPHRLKDK